MLTQSGLDVIMGAGNPWYDDNGVLRATPNYNNIGGQTNWDNLANGSYGYQLIQTRQDFQNLATGSTANKVCGTFQAFSTAEQARSGYGSTDVPGSDPLNANVPTLSEMALGTLNVLDNNANGFFVMMEGGAVDWANHANQAARDIEEQMDFNAAVDSVIGWINTNSNWNDTLLIVTGDHECGFITGPNGELNIVDNGAGVMPGMKYNSGDHTNMLIPLFAKGAGSELFASYANGYDPIRGNYIDNTEIFSVMANATNTVVPEPSSILAMLSGLAGVAGMVIRRKK